MHDDNVVSYILTEKYTYWSKWIYIIIQVNESKVIITYSQMQGVWSYYNFKLLNLDKETVSESIENLAEMIN